MQALAFARVASARRAGRRVGVALRAPVVLAATLLVFGWASAAELCKLSACWINADARNQFECDQGCYFEEDPLDTSLEAQCNALAVHELDVEYMYRDTSTNTAGVGCDGGCITIGIGNKFESVDDAVALAGSFFIRGADGELRAATDQEIRDEFNNLPKQPASCSNDATGNCYGHTYWSSRTSLVLSDEARNGMCQRRLGNEFISGLRGLYGAEAWDQMPSRVQYALVDMAYNLGTAGLRNNWPRFNRAIRNQDWAAAAVDSNRPQLSADRNAYVRELFEAAERDKKAGEERLANCEG